MEREPTALFKKIFFWLIFIGIVLTSVFIIGEISFRLAKGNPNPLYEITQKEAPYLFKPKSVLHQVSSVEGEYKYDAHINNLGYRGKDISLEKPAGKLRILVMGDSFTFGVGAEDNETVPVVLEKRLIEKNIPAEVINAGIGHASPVRHYVNLRDIHLRLNPDVVVLLLDLTDLWDDWHAERNVVYDKNGEINRFDVTYIDGKRNFWIMMMNHSAFCRWIDRKIVRTFKKMSALGFKRYMKIALQGKRAKAAIAESKSVEQDKKIEYDGLLFMRGRVEQELIEQHWARTARYISKIHKICEDVGVSFVLVMYPHGIYVGNNEWNEGRKTWGFEADKIYTDYFAFELGREYAAGEQIFFINALDGFLKAPKDKKYFFDWDGHMTPEGYRILSQTIASDKEFLNLLKEKILTDE